MQTGLNGCTEHYQGNICNQGFKTTYSVTGVDNMYAMSLGSHYSRTNERNCRKNFLPRTRSWYNNHEKD